MKMNDVLLIVLSLLSFIVIYWVLVGQRKHNRMMKEEQIREMSKEKESSEKASR